MFHDSGGLVKVPFEELNTFKYCTRSSNHMACLFGEMLSATNHPGYKSSTLLCLQHIFNSLNEGMQSSNAFNGCRSSMSRSSPNIGTYSYTNQSAVLISQIFFSKRRTEKVNLGDAWSKDSAVDGQLLQWTCQSDAGLPSDLRIVNTVT